ncbi:MAG: cobaltochelatase subunit CobN [Methanobacteriaceae archaeon]
MRKQVTLLVIAFVFALALCGTVAAEDSQGGEFEQYINNDLTSELENQYNTVNNGASANANYNTDIDPEITLTIDLEHPEALQDGRLPIIKVTDSQGNAIDELTITKTGDKTYKVNFISSDTSFNLNVSALGHVPQDVSVIVSSVNPEDTTLYGQANVKLRSYNLLILSGCPNYSKPIVTSNQKLRDEGYYFNLNFFTSTELTSGDTNLENKIKQMASKADLVIIEMISEVNTVNKLYELINGTNAQIIALRCGVGFINDPNIDSNDTVLREYWDGTGEENMGRFQLKALQYVGMYVDPYKELNTINWPTGFIYHPDSEIPMFTSIEEYKNWYQASQHYHEGGSWIGMIAYASTFMNGNSEMQQQILRSLEEKGLNVILAICKGDADRVNAINNFFMDDDNCLISALVSCVGYNIIYSKPDESTRLLQKLNIPIFAPIYASDLENWQNSSSGFSSEIFWQVAWPEMEGRIEPVMMGGVVSNEVDPYTGINIQRYNPLPDRIERITNRVLNWTKLQTLSNSDKKVALIYYNFEGGKDGVGASYLNVPESIAVILKALKNDGYTIPEEYSVDYIINIITTVGNNIGSWAPGELEKLVNAGAITISLDAYMEWFTTLPETLQQKVIDQWGPAPGNIMVYQDKIVIPGIMIGNIFLGSQPMRGWGENSTDIAHSATLPPTHQYIAFYMWLQKDMETNAVIHLGTHGTLEWLPGRSVGLGKDDWPDVLLGNIPNIYPYIIDNTGEGTQAKRRGYAVIIDHLTAPIIASGLYGDLAQLKDLINSYENTELPMRKEILKAQILELVEKLHLHEDLNIDLQNTPFETIKNMVEHNLEELAATLMPYGLHTFGVALDGQLLDQMVESIVSFDPVNRDNDEYREMIRELLSQNFEIQSLLAALRGEYVSPSLGGDPIRRAEDVLPTGMNFYSFDPRTAPDKTAWQIGMKMADDMLEDYFQKNGCYPETVGIVLWSTETMRTVGQSIAIILRFMGLEPKWDKSGRFTGVNITPLEKLNRPRVDVLITISGLFRDTFWYTINILDSAIRMVAKLAEDSEDNYIKKHYLADLNEYLHCGMSSSDAEILAGARIFGPPPEAYGTGVAQLVPATSKWNDQSDLVDTYLSRMSYIYGNGVYGIGGLESFKKQLKNVDVTIQVRDNNYGLLDNDDVYQYLGGLTLAANSISNKDIKVYIANTRINPKIETLAQFMSNEIRTRMLNPKWIDGMLKEGFSGANEIAKEIGYLFAWDAVTSNAVKDWMWDYIANTYVFDNNIRSKFIEANPYAFSSAVAWMLEAINRNMWSADSSTITQLANYYIQTTLQYGVTCCHHTCANLDFNQWLVQISSLNTQKLQQFSNVLKAATGASLTVPQDSSESSDSSNQGFNPPISDVKPQGSVGEVQRYSGTTRGSVGENSLTSQVSSSDPGDSKQASNQDPNSYEVSKTETPSSSQSGLPAYALIGVIFVVGLVAVGYFRGAKK